MSQDRLDWRARIGLLTPACTPNLVCEWSGLLPPGVITLEAIMGMVENTPDQLLQLKQRAIVEAKKLADGLLDIILFACTSGSFVGGPGYDRTIIEEIEKATGTRATTTSTCLLMAFEDLGVKKVSLVGPYTDEVFDREIKFLKANGIETAYCKGMGLKANQDFTRVHEQPYHFYHIAKDAYRAAPDVDCIFISCMASPSRKVINVLEQETGKIVTSSPAVALCGVLKLLGIREPIPEYGRLGRMLGTC